MVLDKLDQKLIFELQRNGRQSFVELANLLQVSEITIRRRVKRLTDSGTIRITTIPDLEALCYTFTCMVGIQVRMVDFDSTVEQITSHANVCYLSKVTGRYDLIAIVVAKSSREFADFLQNLTSNIPGISRTETFVNIDIYKGQAVAPDTSHLVSNLIPS